MKYIVTASSLNIRKGPDMNQPVIGSLKNGTIIEITDQKIADWWKTVVPGTKTVGYVFSHYLKAVEEPPKPVAVLNPHNVKPVHYPVSKYSLLSSVNARHTPLNETKMPFRNPASAKRNEEVHKVIAFLNVEQSARYQPGNGSTYCNIYAYDFCFHTNVYLPRVWWTSKTLIEFSKTPGYDPKPVYAENVLELNANALYDWLNEWGDDFGWIRTFDINELQQKVNEGRVGVVCARHVDPKRSGHITCVVPEGNGQTAKRTGDVVTAPLQSQAGSQNKKYFADTWWIRLGANFSASGLWYHD